MNIRAYEGNKSYIFVSYAHKDSDRVLPIIEKMQNKGYNIWFDAGIEVGTEWPEYIAEHLYGCTAFLSFLSPNYIASQNCRQEINFAIELKKQSLTIFLEDTEIPLGIRMRLELTPQMHINQYGSIPSFLEDLFQNSTLRPCQDESTTGSKGSPNAEQWFMKAVVCDLKKDFSEAIKWYREAADCGHAAAQYALGCSYKSGEGVAQSNYEAVRWWRRAAENGHLQAQYNLGCSLSDGVGTSKNLSESARWFNQAAQRGHAGAMNNLGTCYMNGEGVIPNPLEGIKWFRQAAKLGNREAQFALGICYNTGTGVAQNTNEAINWWKKAAEQGLTVAQHNLGICYSNGVNGVVPNLVEGAKWYRKAAEQGYEKSQLNLGVCYEFGNGVSKDYSEAEKWYRKAAAQGNAKAREGLERIGASKRTATASNIDVEYAASMGKQCYLCQRYSEAVMWFMVAAEHGNAEAELFLGSLASQGLGMEKDPVRGAMYYRSAAEKGNAMAQCFLGNCYASGIGVEYNYIEAVKWLRLAAQNGDEAAKDILRRSSISW